MTPQTVTIGDVVLECRECLDDHITIIVEPDRDEPTLPREKWQSLVNAAIELNGYRETEGTLAICFDKVATERDSLRALLREALEIASKKRTWRTQIGPNNWERVDLGPDREDELRLAEIRRLAGEG